MKLHTTAQTLLLAAIWLPVLEFLELEWRFNEQYHYGYFVPFFTLYLFYLRWEDRPAPSREKLRPGWMLLPLAFLALLQVIETANPDWRLIFWASALAALAATGLLIHSLGGNKWLRHFTPALCMMLFAVPWITSVENRITSSLMSVVSDFTVEMLNLAGIYAVQMGNVIHLQNAVVGIEEACSGVRSLQSSLMAGYLFGEIMRFRFGFRLLLIALGVAVTFVLNLIRTLVLTNVTMTHGAEVFEKWHDTVGNVVAISGFLSIALLAWVLSRIKATHSKPVSPPANPSTNTETKPRIPAVALLLLALIPVSGIILDYCWYGKADTLSDPNQFNYGDIHWNAVSNDIADVEMNPIAVAQLKFSKGNHYQWLSTSGLRWTAFYFYWDQGTISSHAGVHRPENCLPSAGMRQLGTQEILYWDTPEGYKIPFETLTFEGFSGKTYVFFAVWDENGTQPWVSTTWLDRLNDVWKRRIVKGRHSLQFLVENADTFREASSEWKKILDQMYHSE